LWFKKDSSDSIQQVAIFQPANTSNFAHQKNLIQLANGIDSNQKNGSVSAQRITVFQLSNHSDFTQQTTLI
jgi:hypothetical protein